MRFFTCVLDPQGLGLGNRARLAYEALPRQRGLHYEWQRFESAAVLTGWDDPYGDPLVAQDGDWVAAGMVRLDNREEVERWVHRGERATTDLSLAVRVVARYGSEQVAKLLGDFAFVAWNVKTRSGVAACDAFAVRRLYWSEHGRFLSFASRAEALAMGMLYEKRYLLELISLHDSSSDLSVYAGVQQLPRASLALIRQGHSTIHRYWDPAELDVEPSWASAEERTVEKCRHLLAESVRVNLASGSGGGVWAQLSGGIDSSAVTATAQWLASRGLAASGLAGTVTFVDRRGTGTDERGYSDSVVERWGIRNECIVDPPTFLDVEVPPPYMDQPRGDLHVYPRDQKLCQIVRAAGGRVLLTGVGGDELFSGNMLFFADWIVGGRAVSAVREMARRATIGRVSFWELAYRNALLPLLPRSIHSRVVHEQYGGPAVPWLEPQALRWYGLAADLSVTAPAYGGRIGHKYQHAVASTVARIVAPNAGGVIDDALEVRHPLLYRPLVEFALRLPPTLRARPHEHRWIVREALRGILPEKVRTRVGKPGTATFLGWSFGANRAKLAPLVREPILADLGLLDARRFRIAFDDAAHHTTGGGRMLGPLLNTLAVEAWLQHRCGRWPCSEQAGK